MNRIRKDSFKSIACKFNDNDEVCQRLPAHRVVQQVLPQACHSLGRALSWCGLEDGVDRHPLHCSLQVQ
jgi:hypothetical protein